jgi:hypothetical protein
LYPYSEQNDAHTLDGPHIVIASGAQPMKLNIPGQCCSLILGFMIEIMRCLKTIVAQLKKLTCTSRLVRASS